MDNVKDKEINFSVIKGKVKQRGEIYTKYRKK